MALNPQLGPLRLLPLHTGLGSLTQRVYESDPHTWTPKETDGSEGPGIKRRVILTDSLAEGSFCLRGVRYVIDTGLQLKAVSTRVCAQSKA